EEVAHRPEGVDFAVTLRRGAARAVGVADGVAAGILVLPEHLALVGAEAQDALGPGDRGPIEVPAIADVVRGEIVRDEDTVAGDGWASVADANRAAPEDFRPFRWEALDDSGFGPDGVAVGPHPLRPVVGRGG